MVCVVIPLAPATEAKGDGPIGGLGIFGLALVGRGDRWADIKEGAPTIMEVEVVSEVEGADVDNEGIGERVMPERGQVPKLVGEALKLVGSDGGPPTKLQFTTDCGEDVLTRTSCLISEYDILPPIK